jgi:hypothetical protein
MISFFYKFIPNSAERAAPLNALRKKSAQSCWSLDQQRAFENLNLAIMNYPILRMANFFAG